MGQSKEVVSVVLPNVPLTNVTNVEKWIYDLNSPKSNTNAQGNQALDEFDVMDRSDLEINQQ